MCADEEIGGDNGMGEFVKTPYFAEMNVSFALDEGKMQNDLTIVSLTGEACSPAPSEHMHTRWSVSFLRSGSVDGRDSLDALCRAVAAEGVVYQTV